MGKNRLSIRSTKMQAQAQQISEWKLRKYKHHLCTWVDAFFPRGVQQVWHSAALQMQFFTWLPSWHCVGFESDGCVTQPTSPRLFSETIIAKAVYIYCSPSLEIMQVWRREGGVWGGGIEKIESMALLSRRHLLLLCLKMWIRNDGH